MWRCLAVALAARLADEGVGIAVALLALERSGSPAAGGLVMAAWMAPHLLAAPLTGVYAERARRPALFYGAALAAFAVAIAALALLVGRAPLTVALVVAGLGGACGPVVSGGLSALLGKLVPPGAARDRAYGLDSAVYNTAWVAGPALVAVLAGAASAATALLLLAVAAGVAALLAAGLRVPPGDRAESLPARAELAAGLRAFISVPALRAVTASSCVAIFGMGGLTLTAVALAEDQGWRQGGGLLLTVLALGALAGSLVVARRPPGAGPQALAVGSLLLSGVALAAAAAAPSLLLCAVCFAAAGLGEGPLLSAVLRIRAEHAPPALHTQVFTLGAGAKIASAAAGAALTALAVDSVPHAVLLLAIAALQFAAAALLPALNRAGPAAPGPSVAGGTAEGGEAPRAAGAAGGSGAGA